MLPAALAPPLTLLYEDTSSPFALEATVSALQTDPAGAARPMTVTLTLGTGTLHDADKGSFPLDKVVLQMHYVGSGFEPGDLLTPGGLSEFQQAGLLDAVAGALTALAQQASSRE